MDIKLTEWKQDNANVWYKAIVGTDHRDMRNRVAIVDWNASIRLPKDLCSVELPSGYANVCVKGDVWLQLPDEYTLDTQLEGRNQCDILLALLYPNK